MCNTLAGDVLYTQRQHALETMYYCCRLSKRRFSRAGGGDTYRLCGSSREIVQKPFGRLPNVALAGKEHLRSHNKALMVIAVAWAKKYELIDENAVWYNEKWEKGNV